MSPYHRKRILITGGLGFIGSNLARSLVALDADVMLVDSLIPAYGGNLRNIADIEDRVRVNVCDVRDPFAIEYLLRGQDFDVLDAANVHDRELAKQGGEEQRAQYPCVEGRPKAAD